MQYTICYRPWKTSFPADGELQRHALNASATGTIYDADFYIAHVSDLHTPVDTALVKDMAVLGLPDGTFRFDNSEWPD
jgi:hypothetical protein